MRFLFGLLVVASALVARGADDVLLLVNGDSWASTYIANEYAAWRGIPDRNIVELHDLPSFDRMGVEDFRERILRPALKAAEERGLAAQVDYLLYSADFPTAIDVTPDMAGKTFPKAITQPASINSLTFFYQLTLAKNPLYLGLNANFFYRGRTQALGAAPWSEADKHSSAEALAAVQKFAADKEKGGEPAPDPKPLRAALDELLTVKVAHPHDAELLYYLACLRALLGETDAALAGLREAVQNGWWDMRAAANDPSLASLRGKEEFKALAALAAGMKFEHAPTSGFRGLAGWQPGGRLVPPDKGMRYLLSTMLACTSGRGNSVAEALAGLKRSVAADGSRPAGTVYFEQNEDVRSTTREWGFALAAEKIRALGVAAVVEKGRMPLKKNDVAGLMAGVADFDWKGTGSTILPGAICEHLTSFGGVMAEGSGQTPLSEFLRYGAAGASGAVTEPFALQAKFPSPFLHWHYAQGCTLAEAFYQSVSGPYQLLIVGDALCAPWRKRFAVKVEGLKAGAVLQGGISMLPVVASEDGIRAGSFELHLDGRRVAGAKAGEPLGWDTTKAPDGAHDLTVLANGSDALGTRALFTVPVKIRNHADSLQVTAPAGDWPWDRPLVLKAGATGAKSIVFRRREGEIGRIAGHEGEITLDARRLGQGTVRIQPVAIFDEGREVWSDPVVVQVVPPAALPGKKPGGAVEKGFVVTPAGGAPVVVEKSNGDWLAKAGVAAGKAFTIESWFEVAKEDVYQFQLRGLSEFRAVVDDQALSWPAGKAWSFVPVALASGAHHLRIEGNAAGPVEIRFGGAGARRLEGGKFQHVP